MGHLPVGRWRGVRKGGRGVFTRRAYELEGWRGRGALTRLLGEGERGAWGTYPPGRRWREGAGNVLSGRAMGEGGWREGG